MKYLIPLAGALGLMLLSTLSVYAFHTDNPYCPLDTLTRTTVGFGESSTVVPEGSGRLNIEVLIENEGELSGFARVRAAAISTAIEGVDYKIENDSLRISAGSSEAQTISLDILYNSLIGGRFLILEIELPDSSLLALGKRTRHIVLIQDKDSTPPAALPSGRVKLDHLSSYTLAEGASAEILAYDAASSRLFVTNSLENKLAILDFSNPAEIKEIKSVHLGVFGGRLNSVATHNGTVAVAIQGIISTDPGRVVFLDVDGQFISTVTVGAMPDMVLFSPDGSLVLTANEGEPNEAYTIDPEGSISVIDINQGVANPISTTLGFSAFNSQQKELTAKGVRIFGPGATVAQDLEPEYIALSDDGTMAYVTCQENNAVAVVDLALLEITSLWPLGYKDWNAAGLTLDVSNKSGGIFFANWPIKGMYQPDAIDYFRVGGKAYLITANEGHARDYEGYTEEFRLKDKEIVLDEQSFPAARYLKDNELLGRLRISKAMGDSNGDGRLEELYTYGGRSFSIWEATTGALVYDSGNAFEQITAADPIFGSLFNSQNDKNDLKSRSDDKGPEPAAVTVAELNGIPYAFIALERIGGVMVYQLAHPTAPAFVQYINTRTLDSLGGDLSPEGMVYISSEDSPTGFSYILAAHEVSGSVAVFELSTGTTVSFAEANSITEAGAGELHIKLIAEKTGKPGGEAKIKVIAPSNAIEGEDFTLTSASIAIGEGAQEAQSITINILDSDTPGARYLILELDPEDSTVNIGETGRHILLIQDNDGEARR